MNTGLCPVCAGYFILRPDGTLRLHGAAQVKTCSGSGLMPVDDVQYGWQPARLRNQ